MKNFNRREFLKKASLAASGAVSLNYLDQLPQIDMASSLTEKKDRPSILFFNGDDWGWPYCGAYGDKVVRSSAFDRVAHEGILFTYAYCAAPSSTASRGSALTGKMFYLLESGSVLWGSLPSDIEVYPDILEAAGYTIGSALKGWGPGSFADGGWDHQPAGKVFPDFGTFLKEIPEGKPFCFWLGPTSPHRIFPPGSGAASGLRPEEVKVPPVMPDVAEVRNDILDYYNGIERADKILDNALKAIKAIGRYENTIVVATGDNGLPFPRAKANLYDPGVHVPLAISWPARIKAGRIVDDFISQCDLAPTLLEAAGIKPPIDMTGRSFLDVLISPKSGRVDPKRDNVIVGIECHNPKEPFPMRSIRTHNYSYIRNYKPGTYTVSDGGPSLNYMIDNAADPKVKPLYDLFFGSRPAEEFYDLSSDPWEMNNVEGNPAYSNVKKKLASNLEKYLRETRDPRILGEAEKFDKYIKQASLIRTRLVKEAEKPLQK